MTQNINDPLHIIGTDLLDYSFKVEKAIKEGYTFSDSNQYAPRAWPHMFEAWMLLNKENNLVVGVTESTYIEPEVDDVSKVTTVVAENTTPKQVTRRGKK